MGDKKSDTMNQELMSLAVSTAQNARYGSSPRPWVGCVIVNNGEIFTGFTQGKDGPHAEQDALAKAGFTGGALEKSGDLAMYATLEPCAHQGKTPPCTKAIISAGIKKVFVGVLDPDSKVSGKGIKELREAGISVEVGVMEAEITRQLQPYLSHRKDNRPYVVLKLAATLDGKIAASSGASRWITGPEARADAHRLRAESDAVLVGANTIQTDDPQLTVRDFNPNSNPENTQEIKINQPLRAVLGKAPKSAKAQPLLELSPEPKKALQELNEKGVMQVLIEGGRKTAAAFHSAGLIDKYIFYYAPKLLGDDSALQMFHPAGMDQAHTNQTHTNQTKEKKSLKLESVEVLGDDLRLELIPE